MVVLPEMTLRIARPFNIQNSAFNIIPPRSPPIPIHLSYGRAAPWNTPQILILNNMTTDTAIQLITAILTGAAIAIGVWQYLKTRKKEQPSIDTAGSLNFDKSIFEVTLHNNGNAPARLLQVDMYYAGEIISPARLREIIQSIFPEEKTITIESFSKNQVIPGGAKHTLFKLEFVIKPSEEKIKSFFLDSGGVEISYESLDGKRYEYKIRK